MITRKSFQDAPHGRRFLPMLDNPRVPAKQVVDFLNEPRILQRMTDITESIEYPALGAIVKELERLSDIAKYFGKTPTRETLRFRQFVGMAVRLAMEENGFKTTGKKGYIGSISGWFTRAEIFEPSPRNRSGRK